MNDTKDPLIGIVGELLKAARINGTDRPTSEATPEGRRELEILFYGMMCFDPLPTGSGYRVLFPNGLDLTALADIPVHEAGLWVRDRNATVTARWSGPAFRNDFFVKGKHQLTITGLAQTPLNTTAFEGRVTNLHDCDPQFKISNNPDAVIDMIVDRGTLSAHVVNGAGMIVVKWAVQAEEGVPVRFMFGSDFVEIPPTVTQIFLANVSATPGSESVRHFQLFRKLSTSPEKPLQFVPPKTMPTAAIALREPTFGYTPTQPTPTPAPDTQTSSPERTLGRLPEIVGVLPASVREADSETPEIVCSPVVSRLRDAA